MTNRGEIDLSLLQSHFRITSDDGRMSEFVRQLWEPFLPSATSSAATDVEIQTDPKGWRLHSAGDPFALASDPWVLAAVLRNFLSARAVAEATSIVPLHGAAVERDGTFLVLSGPQKAGKTTLLLELLDRGWRLVTDDLVPIEADGRSARPYLKPLSVREPDRWNRYAGRWAVPGWLPAPVNAGLIPATAFTSTDAETYSPSLLVFSRFAPGRDPEVQRLSPAAAVARCGDNLHRPVGPLGLQRLAVLGSETPSWTISYASTETALEVLGKCLAASDPME